MTRDGETIRRHPAKGWQFWSHANNEWTRDRVFPGQLTHSRGVVVEWEDTWCEPEAED